MGVRFIKKESGCYPPPFETDRRKVEVSAKFINFLFEIAYLPDLKGGIYLKRDRDCFPYGGCEQGGSRKWDWREKGVKKGVCYFNGNCVGS